MKENTVDGFFRGAAIAGVIASPSAVDAVQAAVRPVENLNLSPFPAETVVYPPGQARITFAPQEEGELIVAPEQTVTQDLAKNFVSEMGELLEQAGFNLSEIHFRMELEIQNEGNLISLRRYETQDRSASYVYTIAFQENGQLALVMEDITKMFDDPQRLRLFLLYADEDKERDLLITDMAKSLVLRVENVLNKAGEVDGEVPWPLFDEEGNLVKLSPVPAEEVKRMEAEPDPDRPGEFRAKNAVIGQVAGLKIPGNLPPARVEKTEGEPAPTVVPVEAKEVQVPMAIVEAKGLNVRLGPGTGYEKSITLLKDEAVEVTGFSGNWLRIEVDGVEGWISGSDEYIARTGEFTAVLEVPEDQIPALPQPVEQPMKEQPQPVEQQPEVGLSPEQQDFETRFGNWRQWIQKNGSRFIMVGGVDNMNKMIGYEHLTASQARDQFLDTIKPVLEASPKEFQDLIIDNTRYLRVFEPVGAYAGRRAMTTTNEDTMLPHDAFTKPYKGVGMFANLIAIVSSMVHEATHNKAGTVANQADACSAAGDFLEFWIPKLEPGQDRSELEGRLTWIRNGACGKAP